MSYVHKCGTGATVLGVPSCGCLLTSCKMQVVL